MGGPRFSSFCCRADGLRLLFVVELVGNEDTAAVFAYDDFLVLPDFELPLRRYPVETASAGIPLYGNVGQSVADV